MKRFLSFLLCLTLCLALSLVLFPMNVLADGDRYLEINATNFPDATFRQWVIDNLSVSGDASSGYYMTADQVADVTWIDVVGYGIQNLKGVEKFTSLTYLDCAENDLKTLNVSNNKKLQTLGVRENSLTTLDISNNTLLERLWCDYNQLTSLNVSKNTALTEIYCQSNQLTSLDVSKNTKLERLYCWGNSITALNVSANTALTNLECQYNQLTALDVSKNTKLTCLDCGGNKLASLSVSANTALTELWAGENQLTALDVSKNTKLTQLYCNDNKLTSLKISANTALTDLSCQNNQLTSLDVSKNTKLTALWCYSNKLTSLNVTANTALTQLNCFDNQLTALDVSKNTNLTLLICYSNQLTELDVSENTKLEDLTCYSNKLMSLNVASNTALTELSCYDNQLTALDVSKNTKLEFLNCSKNKLSSLNVSTNTALTFLGCSDNQLTALDVSKNTKLITLWCEINKLTSLNVTANTALKFLGCEYNRLTALDVSKNTKLQTLYCYWNKLWFLDLSGNSTISYLSAEQRITGKSLTAIGDKYIFDLSNLVQDKSKVSITMDGATYSASTGVITFASQISEFSYTYATGRGDMVVTVEIAPTYTVTLNPNGGTCATKSITVTYGNTYGTMPTPAERTGYNFDGWWTTKSTGGKQVTKDTVCYATGNFTLYARWKEAATYTVTLNANGGSCTPTSITVTYKNTYGTLPTPTRKGYKFAGWWTTKSTGGKQVTASTVCYASGNFTLYARWTALPSYTVTLNPNGGTCSTPNITVYYSQTYGTLPTPTRRGYKFAGWWTTKATGGKQVTASTVCYATGNFTLYARWTALASYTVTLNPNGGSCSTPNITVYYSQAYGTLPTPTRTGYKFAGWWTTKTTGGKQVTKDTVCYATGNFTLYARWTALASYTITLNANGGSCSTPNITVYYSQTYGTLPTPTRRGYKFAGWWTTKATGGKQVTVSTVCYATGNFTLYARWTALASYTVTLNPNGGTCDKARITVYYSQAYGTLPTPTRTGYTFAGWWTTKTTGGKQVTKDTVCKATGNFTMYARWTAN